MAQARVRPRGEAAFAERFAVFAECLLTGVWIAVACLGLVTYPAAFAAGARHLRRRTGHRAGGLREFAADFRAALRGGWAVGLAGWAAAALAWLEVQAVRAGLRAAAVWAPGERWRTLLAEAGRRTVRDPAGSFLLVGGAVLICCSALLIAPLAVPVLGAVTAAAVAVEERYRRR
ncbi:hypothetical protein A6P39_033345 [Streptomyces sp. FXJ1.172]|uniref:hypothetical protein n=1 Tax=Streptomyces sp. FXJ1.172 TaxID=710705 RepID=UPI0007CFD2EC|nr:hypothetical protein [Streptomyces sp. FXJ1.172]WEO98531.1 hypothetical protein A6P39_033345 [Streptomyces sp. FXJ1.172]